MYYPQIISLFSEHQADGLFTSMHFCKRVLKLPYTRLLRSSSVVATSSTVACLSSWIVMIRLRNTRSFRNPHRKKSGTVSSSDRAGQAMSTKLRTKVTLCCTFQRPVATDHMKCRPLLYRSPFRQPRTSYRADAIFKFEMCQSAPRHPVEILLC